MNVKALADNWKSIGSAIAVTVGLVSGLLVWLDARIEGHVDAGLDTTAIGMERIAVSVNMLRCEILELGPLECDPYDGVPERGDP